MRTTYFYLLIFLLMVVFISCSKNKSGNSDTKNKKQEMVVNACIVSFSDFNHPFTFTGDVLPSEQVELKPEISGRITGIFFQEGMLVKKGQLMIKLNDNDLQAQLKKTSLQLALAIKEEGRKKEMLQINAISAGEYDIALNQVQTLQAEQELVKAQIAKTEIYAPFGGVAGLRLVSEGAIVSTSTVITSLQQVNPVKIEFSIPEKFSGELSTNKEISFTIEGIKQPFLAKVYAIEPLIDGITRSTRLRAICINPDGRLIPGSFATVSIDFDSRHKAILIPAMALIPAIEGEQVFVIKNGKALIKNVKTGLRTENDVEIISGLELNDTVVLSGLLQAKQGIPLKAKIMNK